MSDDNLRPADPEMELAQAMYKVVVSERDFERHRNVTRRLRVEVVIRAWEKEIALRESTKQPAQAALLRECIKDLRGILEGL